MPMVEKANPNLAPDPWVQKYASLIPAGPVLDLACGNGRHGRYFLDLGYPVTFVDKETSGVGDLSIHKNAELMTYDLENSYLESHDLETKNLKNSAPETNASWPYKENQFSGIVVTNYLHRPLFSHLKATVKPGGIIIYKTFSVGNEKFGRPRNPNFLLQEDELRTVFSKQFRELAFFQGLETNPERMTQAICVQRNI
jgi:SAM-dependent methyltransferase